MTDTLLPPNATKAETAIELAAARIGDVPVPVKAVWDPATCPENALPFLAWAFSVDRWDVTWPLAVKRQVVAAAIQVHRVKGTIGAIEDALAALDLDAFVTEWPDFGGDPYTFRVGVDLQTRGLTDAEYDAIEAVILAAKNVRSHLDSLTVYLTNRSRVPAVAMTTGTGEITEIFPHIVDEIEVGSTTPMFAAAMQEAETTIVYPVGA